MTRLLRRPITADEADELAGWSYPPPFDVHDCGDPGVFLRRGDDGEGYHPAVDAAVRNRPRGSSTSAWASARI